MPGPSRKKGRICVHFLRGPYKGGVQGGYRALEGFLRMSTGTQTRSKVSGYRTSWDARRVLEGQDLRGLGFRV